ncbi:MAG TPA: DinB family protein [Candidatus Acidoferrales bacterium]|nr:DinB family protein [Candidatus Acidoferrales bacterium]
MNPEDIREVYEYNAWANRRVLDACGQLSGEQFTRALGASYPSVRDTLQHIMLAEWVWSERWQGRSPSAYPAETFADLSALRARWQAIASELLARVRALTPEELERSLDYRNMKGHTFSSPVREVLLHVANHGTYHRGQVTIMLRQLGATPVATDLIGFYRERSGKPLS